MSPLSARKPDGRCYRYYVSSSRQKGRPAQAGVLHRVPAEAIETLVSQRAVALELVAPEAGEPWPAIRAAVQRVDIAPRHVRITIACGALPADFDLARSETRLSPKDKLAIVGDTLVLTTTITLTRRGQGKVLTGPDGASVRTGQLDPALSRALAQAEAWKRRLLAGGLKSLAELARSEGLQTSQCERILRLAFLAPDLKRAILDGCTPPGLMLQRLRTDGVPDLWADQRRQVRPIRRRSWRGPDPAAGRPSAAARTAFRPSA